MKRVKAACIFQTLIFSQKDNAGLSKETAARLNHEEAERYKRSLERDHIRHRIVEDYELEDGTVLLKVRKQYNDSADVNEYFEL